MVNQCMLLIKKDILVLGKGSTQVLNDTTIKVESKYSINLQDQKENFVETWIIMEATVIHLLMTQKYIN